MSGLFLKPTDSILFEEFFTT